MKDKPGAATSKSRRKLPNKDLSQRRQQQLDRSATTAAASTRPIGHRSHAKILTQTCTAALSVIFILMAISIVTSGLISSLLNSFIFHYTTIALKGSLHSAHTHDPLRICSPWSQATAVSFCLGYKFLRIWTHLFANQAEKTVRKIYTQQ